MLNISLTWREIAEIHGMGFEIGNHAWTHGDFSTPRGASHLAGELALTDFVHVLLPILEHSIDESG